MSSNISALISREETLLIKRITNYIIRVYPTIIEGDLLITKEDLHHYGIQGLLEAKSTFDRSKKIPWLAFASFRVKGAMLDQIRKLPMIKVSHGCYSKIKQMEKVRVDLLKKHGSVSSSLLAAELKWSFEEINSVLNLAQVLQPIKKFDLAGNEDSHVYLYEKSKYELSTENMLIRKELIEQLVLCLQELSDEDRLILTSRTIQDTKLRELAECISCSPENIRLRQKKAAKQVQSCLKNNSWPAEKCLEVMQ
jgi:RNA polymerase sigma factor for flagellar operon FliA